MKNLEERIAAYSKRYPAGTIIELTAPINDRFTPKPIGSRFEVDIIDAQLQLHGRWLPPESGSMAVSLLEDSFKVISKKIQVIRNTEAIHISSSLDKQIDYIILLETKEEIGTSIKLVDRAMTIINDAYYQWLEFSENEKLASISLINHIKYELNRAEIKYSLYIKSKTNE